MVNFYILKFKLTQWIWFLFWFSSCQLYDSLFQVYGDVTEEDILVRNSIHFMILLDGVLKILFQLRRTSLICLYLGISIVPTSPQSWRTNLVLSKTCWGGWLRYFTFRTGPTCTFGHVDPINNYFSDLNISWASVITLCSSLIMVGFSNWTMNASTYWTLSLAEVRRLGQVLAFLLKWTRSKVQVMAYCHLLLASPLTWTLNLAFQYCLAFLNMITFLAPVTLFLNWRSLSPSLSVSSWRLATTRGCFLLLRGLLMVMMALTGERTYWPDTTLLLLTTLRLFHRSAGVISPHLTASVSM